MKRLSRKRDYTYRTIYNKHTILHNIILYYVFSVSKIKF